ncbi:hypothetical protein ACF0H5_013553 [Mactra antiquata]
MDSCDKVGTNSSFIKEVGSLPVVQSVKDLYTSTRSSSRVLNTGLAVVEFTLSNVWNTVFSRSTLGSRIDDLAGSSVSKLREKYPALNKTPDEIKGETTMSLKKKVRGMMKSKPGVTFIHGLDWALDRSEALLDRMSPTPSSPRKQKVTRAVVKQAQVAKDHAYASEDSGACEAENAPEKCKKTHVTTTDHGSRKMKFSEELGMMDKLYRLSVVLPLEVLVQSLKSFRRYVGGKRKLHQLLSPEKEKEIGSRRKLSPKKKVQSSFLGKLRSRMNKALGYNLTHVDLSRVSGTKSPDRLDAEKKRKHEEIASDEGSDIDDDFNEFDYDNYQSEDDPDYEPESSEDSEDSDIDDVEDDIGLNGEAETITCVDCDVKPPDHHHFYQLKDDQNDAKLIVKGEEKKTEPEVSCGITDDSESLKPTMLN